jgi:flagellar biosynthetic protein FlhB
MGEEAGDKSEEPTPHKLREARKKGQVAKSKEITTAVLVFVSFWVFKSTAAKDWMELVSYTNAVFNSIPTVPDQFEFANIMDLYWRSLWVMFRVLAPLMLTIFFVVIIIEGIQTGFLFSSESIIPKLEKINPMSGLKRIFSMKGLVQILLSLAKIIIVIFLTWNIIQAHLPQILSSMNDEPWTVMLLTGSLVFKIAMRIALFYIIIAILDYAYQRFSFRKQMMMTKQEVKEEYKRLEGDPTIKQRQRQIQREMAQNRQARKVPNADVVVTNPTHIAIAILYNPKLMKSPQVVAKGKRLVAEQIKAIADEHNVPIVENIALARGLYDAVEVGSEVPSEFYRAVAEVLAFVYRLGRNQKKRNNPANKS